MTVREALLETTRRLELQRIPYPRLCAETLLTHCLSVDRAFLFTHDDDLISEIQSEALDDAIYQRISGVPVQYIVGRQEFYGRDFMVNPSVLIPRPETEFIVDGVLEWKPCSGARIIDVGTGSGCIAITLALELPEAQVFAGDISENALRVAQRNARALKANVAFVSMDLLDAVAGAFDFVVSNPPYVRREDVPYLQREVRDHEPHVALFSNDGIGIYRRLIDSAESLLRPGGKLLMEIGFGMVPHVDALIGERWIKKPARTDLQGIPRTVIATRKPI